MWLWLEDLVLMLVSFVILVFFTSRPCEWWAAILLFPVEDLPCWWRWWIYFRSLLILASYTPVWPAMVSLGTFNKISESSCSAPSRPPFDGLISFIDYACWSLPPGWVWFSLEFECCFRDNFWAASWPLLLICWEFACWFVMAFTPPTPLGWLLPSAPLSLLISSLIVLISEDMPAFRLDSISMVEMNFYSKIFLSILGLLRTREMIISYIFPLPS